MTLHFNIGSNRGDRTAMIASAVHALAQAIPGRLRMSSVIESEPWGYESDNRFLNIGVAIETDSMPDIGQLIRITQEIEQSIDPSPHRNQDGSYKDRAIDIDIIAAGNIIADMPELTLPHPRAHLREFVLIPLIQLDPSWRHPLLGLTPQQMLSALTDGTTVADANIS